MRLKPDNTFTSPTPWPSQKEQLKRMRDNGWPNCLERLPKANKLIKDIK